MTQSRHTVAGVIRSCLDEFLERYGSELTPEQRRALKDLVLSVNRASAITTSTTVSRHR